MQRVENGWIDRSFLINPAVRGFGHVLSLTCTMLLLQIQAVSTALYAVSFCCRTWGNKTGNSAEECCIDVCDKNLINRAIKVKGSCQCIPGTV